MFKFSLEALTAHINDDNDASLKIYNDLVTSYNKSLTLFPKEVNLIGVYFVDILKLLTHTYFKDKEIGLDITPNNIYTSQSLNTWPYIGYKDIYNGCDIESKIFGKGNDITQSQLKLFSQFIVNTQYLFRKNFYKKLSLITPRIDSGSNLLWLRAPNIKTNLLNLESGWFGVPQLDDQIRLLKKYVIEIIEKNNHPISSKLISSLLENHIKADCYSGNSAIQFNGDILLLSSGLELQNRMLSLNAMQQGIPVINIMHGEAFGVHDEPIFSDFCECIYSDAVLGYGLGFSSVQNSYQFGINKDIKYIQSNGVNTSKYFKKNQEIVCSSQKNIRYFYYPTTLSGVSHRYGPFRDTADSLYLSWQETLFRVFENSITIKSHPKEKYGLSYSFPNINLVSGSFSDLLNEVEVFVFDYIGTAFNEACSTNKPVIYFDLGIRNIHIDALRQIKERTIYFDIKHGMPTLSEIQDRLFNENKENTYTVNYSLCNNDKDRVQSLSEGIQKFF